MNSGILLIIEIGAVVTIEHFRPNGAISDQRNIEIFLKRLDDPGCDSLCAASWEDDWLDNGDSFRRHAQAYAGHSG